MTVLDDDKFPPLGAAQDTDTANAGPLDLSVLAQVSAQEQASRTEQPPQEQPADTPPRPSGRRTAVKDRKPSGNTRGTGTASGTPRTFVRDEETPEYRPGILVKPLRDLYVLVGTGVLPFNQPLGTAFIQNAEACAKSLDNAAKTDKRIRNALMLLIQGSVWGEIAVAHAPIAMTAMVTLFPGVARQMTPLIPQPAGTGQDESETVNPVSNGYAPR